MSATMLVDYAAGPGSPATIPKEIVMFLAVLKTLVAPSAKAKPPSANIIEKALADARADHAAATTEISKLQASRLLALVDAEQRAKHAAALAAARQRADDTTLVAEELERCLVEARANEQETERRRRYDAAVVRRDALAAEFPGRHQTAVGGLLELLRETSEVDAELDIVNEALPSDADPIPNVEAMRDRPGLPRKVTSRTSVELWASPGADQPIPDEMQGRVKREGESRGDGKIWGFINHVNKAIGYHSLTHYVLQKFERIDYLTGTLGENGPRLQNMPLPALRAGEPDLFRPRPFLMSPRMVLAALDDAAAQPCEPREHERREKRTEFRLVRDQPPAEPTPSTVHSV